MKKYILFFFILSTSFKCYPQWTQCNGPFGGFIKCLAENKKSNTLFAGTHSSGIFRFKNSVNHWENLSSKLPRNGIDEMGIMDSIIFVAAHDSYSSRRGLFKSIDNGDSWDTLYVDSTVATYGVNNIFCNDSLLIISTYSKIYVSTDAGNSFNEIGHNLTDTASTIYDLMIEDGRIFAVYHSMSYNATISYSDDLGQSWQKPTSPNGWSYECKRLRAYSNKLYTLSTGHVNVSADFGVTWDSLPTPGIPWFYSFSDMYISNDTILLGSTSHGIFLSTNSGITYNLTSSGMPLQKNDARQFLNSTSKGLLVATEIGIYNSINMGLYWNDFNDNLIATFNYCLASCNNELFIGSSIQGVFGTTDNGNTWIRKSVGLENYNQFQNIITITNLGNRLILGTSNRVYYSDNNGISWTHVTNGIQANQVGRFTYDQSRLYAGTGGGICYSDDSAITWHKINSFPGCQASAIYVEDSLIIGESACYIMVQPYFTSEIKRSVNYGASFSTVSTSLVLYDIEKIGTLFIGANQGSYLAKSSDGGVTWSLDNTFATQGGIHDIYIANSKFVFLGTGNGTIYLSKDSAITWLDITDNFKGVPTEFLKFGNTLFVTTLDNGVWKKDISNLVGAYETTNSNYNFILYPNPTDGAFSFTIPDALKRNRNFTLTIYDNTGKLVKKIPLDNTQSSYKISLKNESAGLYFISLNGGDVHYSTKMIRSN